MARVCEICGKKPTTARKYRKTMSRYNPHPQKPKKPNLQWVTLHSGKRVKACTKCIKKLAKEGKI